MLVTIGRNMPDKPQFAMVFSVGPKKDTPREHYTTGVHDIKTMKKNVVAFKGRYVVIAERDEFWGGALSRTYQSKILTDPTWGQLFRCAKAAQKRTLDLHHAFFEGAYVRKFGGPDGTIQIDGDVVHVLQLALGS